MTVHEINFAAVKEQASFEAILSRYGIELTGRGAQRVALCPFHPETKGSLSVNLEHNVFHCFGCEAKGSVLDFVAKIENVSIRDAAAIAAECSGLSLDQIQPPPRRVSERTEASLLDTRTQATHGAAAMKESRSQQEGNVPLSFTLRIDPKHPYLERRGITPQLAETFGLGYCSQGMMRARVCIPIHDEAGDLVAYTGRWASDELPEGEPRYRLPPRFRKSHVLYNLNRVAGAEHLVIVEGYWSVFRLYALGSPAVALMGCTLSARQEELLTRSCARRLTLLLDGDEPGRRATQELLPRLAQRFFVHVGKLPHDAQPDTVSAETLRTILRLC